MAGGGRRCEVTKLLEASTGKVLVRLEEIDQQGIYLVDVQQGRAVLVLCTFEFRFFNQIFLQRCIGTEIHGFDADVLLEKKPIVEEVNVCSKVSDLDLEMLEDLLEDAVEKEDYELAVLLRDKINELKGRQKGEI